MSNVNFVLSGGDDEVDGSCSVDGSCPKNVSGTCLGFETRRSKRRFSYNIRD